MCGRGQAAGGDDTEKGSEQGCDDTENAGTAEPSGD